MIEIRHLVKDFKHRIGDFRWFRLRGEKDRIDLGENADDRLGRGPFLRRCFEGQFGNPLYDVNACSNNIRVGHGRLGLGSE